MSDEDAIGSIDERTPGGLGYVHCATCMDQKPSDISPSEWSTLEVAVRPVCEEPPRSQLLIGCRRCGKLVASFHIDYHPTRQCVICGECHDEWWGI